MASPDSDVTYLAGGETRGAPDRSMDRTSPLRALGRLLAGV